MTEIIHNCSHVIGCCGETHPNLITFLIGNDYFTFKEIVVKWLR